MRLFVVLFVCIVVFLVYFNFVDLVVVNNVIKLVVFFNSVGLVDILKDFS